MAGCLLHLRTNRHWWQAVCPESQGWLSDKPGTETREFWSHMPQSSSQWFSSMLALQLREKNGSAWTISSSELQAVLQYCLGTQGRVVVIYETSNTKPPSGKAGIIVPTSWSYCDHPGIFLLILHFTRMLQSFQSHTWMCAKPNMTPTKTHYQNSFDKICVLVCTH